MRERHFNEMRLAGQPLDALRELLLPPDETAFVFTFGGQIGVPDDHPTTKIKAHVLCDPLAEGWWQDYREHPGDRAADPIRRAIRHSIGPVHWNAFDGRDDMSETEQSMWRRARDRGICDGLSAPIHDVATNRYGALSAVHFGRPRDFDDWLRKQAPAFGPAAYLVYHAIAEPLVCGKPECSLSRRERQCLGLVADGLSSKEIGRQLDLSPRTVELHIARAMARLQAANRSEAVARALRNGWLT